MHGRVRPPRPAPRAAAGHDIIDKIMIIYQLPGLRQLNLAEYSSVEFLCTYLGIRVHFKAEYNFRFVKMPTECKLYF